MVVPTVASAQEQGSEADTQLTDEVTAEEATNSEDPATEEPATETPPADPPQDAVEPTEPTDVVEEPAPSEAPADSAGSAGTVDTSKAAAPEASSEPAPAPAPEPAPADVAAAEAEATDSAGNSGGGDGATATRRSAGGGDLEATKLSSASKPNCLERGQGSDTAAVHGAFPDDGSCAQSLFNNGSGLDAVSDNDSDLSLVGPNGTVTLDIWSTDGGDTVNVKVLTGGPVALDLYVKGGPNHNVCTDNNLANGETMTCSPVGGGFSHLDVCVRPPTTVENPPPVVLTPPVDEDVPPDREDEVLTEEEREQRDQEEEEQVVEAVPPTAVPTAVTTAPEEALPFTGLDTGWLVLLSAALLGTGVLLRRKVS